MSETGTISNTKNPNNLGELAPGCQVKIQCSDTGKLLGSFEQGEILVKTPTIMKGYLNRPKENTEFFNDPDHFVHTGDTGFFDDHGILHYSGRCKELIKFQNCHIYPGELEDIALRNPNIVEIGIYGKKDPNFQELVAAVVVKKENSSLSENEVVKFINDKVADFKGVKGGVKFVKAIPRNPQGKIIRSKLHLI